MKKREERASVRRQQYPNISAPNLIWRVFNSISSFSPLGLKRKRKRRRKRKGVGRGRRRKRARGGKRGQGGKKAE